MSLGLGLGSVGLSRPDVDAAIISLDSPSSQTIAVADGAFTEFTIFMKFNFTGNPVGDEIIFDLNNDANNFVQLKLTSAGTLVPIVESGGTTFFSDYAFPTADYLIAQGETSVIISGNAAGIKFFVNGVDIGEPTVFTLPTGVPDNMGVGQTAAAGSTFSETMVEFQYYDIRLGDSTLRGLGKIQDFGVSTTFDATRNIILEEGQSNSVGAGTSGREISEYLEISAMDRIEKDGTLTSPFTNSFTATALWTLFTNGSDFQKTGVIADGLSAQLSGTVAVANVNKGGEGLFAGGTNPWLPQGKTTNNTDFMSDRMYQHIMMENLYAQWGNLYTRIWHQGETDAADAQSVSQANYETALGLWLDIVNLYNPVDLTIVVVLHDTPSSGFATWTSIQAAQANANTIDSTARAVTSAGRDVAAADIHLDGDGLAVLGYDILKEILLRKGLTVPSEAFQLKYSINLLSLAIANSAQMTFSSGVDVETWGGTIGYDWNGGPGAFTEPEFDSTLFDGVGGVKSVGTLDGLESDAFTATAVQTSFMTLFYPTPTLTSTFFYTAGKVEALVAMLSNSKLRYRNDEGGPGVVMTTGFANQRNLLVLEYASTSSLVIRNNGAAVTGGAFDPEDGYSTETKLGLMAFAGGGNEPGVQFRQVGQANVVFKSDLLGHIEAEMAADAGITLP